MKEPFRSSNRPVTITDESLDSFMTRRFGEPFARVFGSALVHGIYAGDSGKLSVRAAFPALWDAEERGGGSLVLGFARPAKKDPEPSYEIGVIQDLLTNTAVYSFRDGMQTICDALSRSLDIHPNVRIHCNTDVSALRPKQNKTFVVCLISFVIDDV